MTTILKGSGSSLAHALVNAGANALGAVRVQSQGLTVRDYGSAEVFFNLVSDPRVPLGTIYSGTGPTVATALTASGVGTQPKVLHMDVGKESVAGSVSVLFTLSSDATPATLYSGTGWSMGSVITASGLSGVTNPRIYKKALAMDNLGSVTGIFAVTSYENVPN